MMHTHMLHITRGTLYFAGVANLRTDGFPVGSCSISRSDTRQACTSSSKDFHAAGSCSLKKAKTFKSASSRFRRLCPTSRRAAAHSSSSAPLVPVNVFREASVLSACVGVCAQACKCLLWATHACSKMASSKKFKCCRTATPPAHVHVAPEQLPPPVRRLRRRTGQRASSSDCMLLSVAVLRGNTAVCKIEHKLRPCSGVLSSHCAAVKKQKLALSQT